MAVQFKKSLIGLMLVCFVGLFAPAQAEGFKVVASIAPVHSILAGLMEGVGQPELLAKDALPYQMQMGEAQRQQLADADALIWIGPELEAYLVPVVKDWQANGRKVVTLLDDKALKVLPSRWNETERDPNFWLDTRNALILLDELTLFLIESDPGHTHVYRANRDRLYRPLADFDRRLENGYRGMKAGIGMQYYDTLQYFEQAYALKVSDVLTQAPGTAPSGERLLNFRARLAEGAYACFFTEQGIEMPELPLLTTGVKLNSVELNSFGQGFEPGPKLYELMMRHNTQAIKQCFARRRIDLGVDEPVEEEPIEIIRGRFMLTDHHGKLVSDNDMLGKYQLIYFGYTFCPDVCPTSLQVISAALDMLGDKADRLQPYFITVDPERDTPTVMAAYVNYFNKRIIGLSGSRSMTDRVIQQFKVVAEKVEEPGADADKYIMDHTASVFLMAPDGSFITKFAHGITPQQMVEKLNGYLGQ